jgi:hypothetical protein
MAPEAAGQLAARPCGRLAARDRANSALVDENERGWTVDPSNPAFFLYF